MNYLYQYLLFLAEVASVGLAVVIAAGALIGMSTRNRREGAGHIEIRRLNDQFEAVRDVLDDMFLSGRELRRANKARKKERDAAGTRSRVFVLDFQGDIEASATDALREEVSGILVACRDGDEVVVRLESAGGVVHGYGFAASQLARIKARGLRLVVAVDKIAASGGYLMACIADELISAPFALLGSIGVLVEVPNVHRLLKKHDVDVEILTAGEHKRTLTLLGQNTDEGRAKLLEEIEDVHKLFQEFVGEHRPNIELAKVATGEAWYGTRALGLSLVDRLETSDQYLQSKLATAELLGVAWVVHRKGVEGLMERLSGALFRRFANASWLRNLLRGIATQH